MLKSRFLVASLYFLAGVLVAWAGEFQQALEYQTGSRPQSVVTADFDGDGTTDLATANSSDDTVSILLGKGDGTFQRHVDYGTGHTPYALAVGDFNRDSNQDIVTANHGLVTVSILLGNGDGTFREHAGYRTPNVAMSVAVGDLNRDGNADLAVVTWDAEFNVYGLSVLLGAGNGTFQSPVNYETGEGPYSVALEDFNGDGYPDVVVATLLGGIGGNTLDVFLNNGDGTLKRRQSYGTGGSPHSVAAGDFNGDHKTDLATANYTDPGTVSVLIGKGNGTFETHKDYPAGSLPTSVAVGDVNGDRKLDLAIANLADGTVSVLLGNGNGTFQGHIDYGPEDISPQSVALGELNRDGALDLVLANSNNEGVSVLLNTGGTFVTVTSSPNPSQLGQAVTLTTTVTASLQNVGSPTGSVKFRDGAVTLGTAPLTSGQATLTTSNLNAGKHKITARYSGDSIFNPHDALPIIQKVLP